MEIVSDRCSCWCNCYALAGRIGVCEPCLSGHVQSKEAVTEIVKFPLLPNEVEVLKQLCSGPIWDGDLISKIGRDGLVTRKLAFQINGWQSLTSSGVEYAIQLGILKDSGSGQHTETGAEIGKPTQSEFAAGCICPDRDCPRHPKG